MIVLEIRFESIAPVLFFINARRKKLIRSIAYVLDGIVNVTREKNPSSLQILGLR